MDAKAEEYERLFRQGEHREIVNLIEQIPESERDWTQIGWYVRSLNNIWDYERALEVSLRYRERGASDPLWHYRLGFALFYLNREEEAEAAFLRAQELGGDLENLAEWIVRARAAAEARRLKNELESRRRAAKKPRDPEREPFENFDFTGFWDDSDWALKEYVGAPATDEWFAEAERLCGYKLPASYKWLMRRHNGGIPAKPCCPVETPTSWAEDHVAVTGIFGVDPQKTSSLLGEFGGRFMIESWDYPDIGIAICDCPSAGHDMIFLDYRHCGPEGEPEVVHIDQEDEYEITLVADDFESFIRALVSEEEFED